MRRFTGASMRARGSLSRAPFRRRRAHMQTSLPEAPQTATMSYAAAIVDGLYEVLRSDPRAGIIYSLILGLGQHQALFRRIADEFPERIFDPPYCEAATAGLGAGAAMM